MSQMLHITVRITNIYKTLTKYLKPFFVCKNKAIFLFLHVIAYTIRLNIFEYLHYKIKKPRFQIRRKRGFKLLADEFQLTFLYNPNWYFVNFSFF